MFQFGYHVFLMTTVKERIDIIRACCNSTPRSQTHKTTAILLFSSQLYTIIAEQPVSGVSVEG